MDAMLEMEYWLKRGGLTEHKIDVLISVFLEQEERLYVKCMDVVEN